MLFWAGQVRYRGQDHHVMDAAVAGLGRHINRIRLASCCALLSLLFIACACA